MSTRGLSAGLIQVLRRKGQGMAKTRPTHGSQPATTDRSGSSWFSLRGRWPGRSRNRRGRCPPPHRPGTKKNPAEISSLLLFFAPFCSFLLFFALFRSFLLFFALFLIVFALCFIFLDFFPNCLSSFFNMFYDFCRAFVCFSASCLLVFALFFARFCSLLLFP